MINIEKISFEMIEKELRKQSFAVLSTVSPNGYSQSTGVLYVVSSPELPFALYIVMGSVYHKVKNIKNNLHVSILIPFPHHFFRFVPDNTIAFQAFAEIHPLETPEIIIAFQNNRVLKRMIDVYEPPACDIVFLKIKPIKRVHCYGIGINLIELRRDHAAGSYTVIILESRLLRK